MVSRRVSCLCVLAMMTMWVVDSAEVGNNVTQPSVSTSTPQGPVTTVNETGNDTVPSTVAATTTTAPGTTPPATTGNNNGSSITTRASAMPTATTPTNGSTPSSSPNGTVITTPNGTVITTPNGTVITTPNGTVTPTSNSTSTPSSIISSSASIPSTTASARNASTTAVTPNKCSSGSSLDTGAVIGVTVSCFTVLLALFVGYVVYRRWKRGRNPYLNLGMEHLNTPA